MNRFRTKKTGRDEASNGNRPLVAVKPSGPFRMVEKAKAQSDESKREFDLTTVLPSRDDFRTSLLMTGLSARFSLLRENDDPNSNLSEVSDDIAVNPKMQPRLAYFDGLQNWLHDITGTESLKASSLRRLDSYQTDDTALIESRSMCISKPTEGSNLFGDRQKIYKLAAGAPGDLYGHELYDDGVAQCLFQRWSQAEKERITCKARQCQDMCEVEPAEGYNHRRETSSTLSSTPSAARNPAATSIASQPSFRHATSTSRLPGRERSVLPIPWLNDQGLKQDLQSHQLAAISRLDISSKQCAPDPSSAIHSSTISAFGDRDHRLILSTASLPNPLRFRPSTVDSFHMSSADSTDKYLWYEQKPNFGTSPPLSPPTSENEDHTALSIQSGDRGTMTAIGAITQPAMRYGESQCVQSQCQPQQGRDISVSRYPIEGTASSVRQPPRSSLTKIVLAEVSRANSPPPEKSARKVDPTRTVMDYIGDSSIDNRNARFVVSPCYTIGRPDDQEHPAFRKSAILTPISPYSPKDSDAQGSLSPNNTKGSPTLGHNTGLFDMVRQHLRSNSTASSVYSFTNHETELSSTETSGSNSPRQHDKGNAEDVTTDERDEFAQHLIDSARHVRERLTTYIESDSYRVGTNQSIGLSNSNGFGRLGSKSTRGLLFPKNEKKYRTKAVNSHNSHTNTEDISPSSREYPSSRERLQVRGSAAQASEPAPARPDDVHLGLKAYHQAYPERQEMKRVELQRRHTQKSWSTEKHLLNSRDRSYVNGLPPALANLLPPVDQSYDNRSQASSRATSERYRRGSESREDGHAYVPYSQVRNGTKEHDKENKGLRVTQHIKLHPLQELCQAPVRSSKDLFMSRHGRVKM